MQNPKDLFIKVGAAVLAGAALIVYAIKIQKASELEKGNKFELLGDYKEFRTDREIILQYLEFCKKFFANC